MSRESWGPITWYFMHSFAEHIDAKAFKTDRENIKGMLKSILECLPCPTCSLHATKYIASSNWRTIGTKEELRSFMFTFHNSVNRQLSKKPFSRQQYDELYPRANISKIWIAFIRTYSQKNRSEHMMMESFARSRIIRNWRAWIAANTHNFSLP